MANIGSCCGTHGNKKGKRRPNFELNMTKAEGGDTSQGEEDDGLSDYEVPEKLVSEIRREQSRCPVVVQPSSSTHVHPEKQFAELRDAFALIDFKSQAEDELSFHEGEELEVVVIRTKLYWDARSKKTGEHGLVNENHISLKPLDKTETPANLERSQSTESWLESLFVYSKPWFKGKISDDEAANILSSEKTTGAFLIRQIEDPVYYYLSVRGVNDTCKHYGIRRNSLKKFYIFPEDTFDSIDILISYYSENQGQLCCQLRESCEEQVTSSRKSTKSNDLSQPEYQEIRYENVDPVQPTTTSLSTKHLSYESDNSEELYESYDHDSVLLGHRSDNVGEAYFSPHDEDLYLVPVHEETYQNAGAKELPHEHSHVPAEEYGDVIEAKYSVTSSKQSRGDPTNGDINKEGRVLATVNKRKESSELTADGVIKPSQVNSKIYENELYSFVVKPSGIQKNKHDFITPPNSSQTKTLYNSERARRTDDRVRAIIQRSTLFTKTQKRRILPSTLVTNSHETEPKLPIEYMNQHGILNPENDLQVSDHANSTPGYAGSDDDTVSNEWHSTHDDDDDHHDDNVSLADSESSQVQEPTDSSTGKGYSKENVAIKSSRSHQSSSEESHSVKLKNRSVKNSGIKIIKQRRETAEKRHQQLYDSSSDDFSNTDDDSHCSVLNRHQDSGFLDSPSGKYRDPCLVMQDVPLADVLPLAEVHKPRQDQDYQNWQSESIA